jgi:hemolysin III
MSAQMMAQESGLQRPLLRGYFHAAAAGAAVVGLVLLVLLAESPRAYVGGAIFAASLILLYLTSATYHTITWGRRMRAVLKRLDHSMIFVLIGGTYTPFCLLILNDAWGISMLSVIWGVAAAGILLKVVWPGAPRWLGVLLYASAGWMAVVASAPLADWIAAGPLTLLVGGGVLYTVGGVIYALRRPDPFPQVFGYHEIFHLLVIAGSVMHYTLVAAYLMPA